MEFQDVDEVEAIEVSLLVQIEQTLLLGILEDLSDDCGVVFGVDIQNATITVNNSVSVVIILRDFLEVLATLDSVHLILAD